MSILIGKAAPNFNLFNTEKKEIELNGLKGKNIVLLFFPLAFTSTCTKELCEVRDSIAMYNNLNAVVLGISVDSLFSLAKFKAEQNLNFDLLSDFNKTASTDYHSIYAEFIFNMHGVSKRSAFVIDKNGVVKHEEILESAGDIPSFEKIVNTLKELN
ncbi:MAG: peroxiredoxin [Bacteroidia bacterium]|nr:peroxiredoxin [Bacteroidia bacterium]